VSDGSAKIKAGGAPALSMYGIGLRAVATGACIGGLGRVGGPVVLEALHGGFEPLVQLALTSAASLAFIVTTTTAGRFMSFESHKISKCLSLH